jgi:hypothetical protein
MERARNFLIWLGRGMASFRPVCGLLQMGMAAAFAE